MTKDSGTLPYKQRYTITMDEYFVLLPDSSLKVRATIMDKVHFMKGVGIYAWQQLSLNGRELERLNMYGFRHL